MSKRGTLALLAAFAAAGCYSYRPLATTAVAPGQMVRVTLSPEEALRQQENVGALRQQIEGEVVESNSQAIGITVPRPPSSPTQRSGMNTFVTLPTSSIVQMEEKRFSPGKTALLAGAGAAAAVAILSIVEAVTGDGGDEGPPNNSLVRIPIGRFFFR